MGLLLSGCYYNGVVHNKGDKFDDGCKYNCECIDDMTGQYQCSQRYKTKI